MKADVQPAGFSIRDRRSGSGKNAVVVALVAGAMLLAVSHGTRASGQSAGSARANRFDMQVREDFFSGFAGDAESLERGMKRCEEALAKDPKNAEALVWHGSGLSYSAKKQFMAGNYEEGRKVQAQGIQEMNDAVAMAPDNVAVLIPRASVFLSAALHVPSPEIAKKNFRVAADDYEKILRLQEPTLANLPVHARGELLGGLAEAWNGLGETEKSRSYLQRMAEQLPGTPYETKAKEVLAAAPKSGTLGTTCLGCHVSATR